MENALKADEEQAHDEAADAELPKVPGAADGSDGVEDLCQKFDIPD